VASATGFFVAWTPVIAVAVDMKKPATKAAGFGMSAARFA
jgi:hypothetical protein